jgi:hypothetical protein
LANPDENQIINRISYLGKMAEAETTNRLRQNFLVLNFFAVLALSTTLTQQFSTMTQHGPMSNPLSLRLKDKS